jgi:prepilin-type N-terminal cleavage/methylation domain-containing protein/prepilin-type processing-associated H-X9-DG protein
MLSHSTREVSPRRRLKAFTLVELLVVIGIIALLISILLPSLAKAREQGIRTKCLNNTKQLAYAFQVYLNENRQFVPAVNWGNGDCGGRVKAGWLYECKADLSKPLPVTAVETGAFYPLLKTREIFRCPTHPPEPIQGKTDTITSYLMNGAINGYGKQKLYKVNQFKITDALIWEADERPFNGVPPFNDGSSFPWETFDPNTPQAAGLGVRHGKYATIAYVGGHADLVPHDEIYRVAAETGRNWLWCAPAPDSPNGH